MSWAGEALKSLKKVILIEEKVATLADDVKLLALRYQDISERLARIEGKLETYERAATAAVGHRRLPRPGKKKA